MQRTKSEKLLLERKKLNKMKKKAINLPILYVDLAKYYVSRGEYEMAINSCINGLNSKLSFEPAIIDLYEILLALLQGSNSNNEYFAYLLEFASKYSHNFLVRDLDPFYHLAICYDFGKGCLQNKNNAQFWYRFYVNKCKNALLIKKQTFSKKYYDWSLYIIGLDSDNSKKVTFGTLHYDNDNYQEVNDDTNDTNDKKENDQPKNTKKLNRQCIRWSYHKTL